jgi:hypothetical protein
MKGDFSRWTFDPRRHYTAVLMQQGRVQLDSDWNEQAAMLEHLDRTRFGGCRRLVRCARWRWFRGLRWRRRRTHAHRRSHLRRRAHLRARRRHTDLACRQNAPAAVEPDGRPDRDHRAELDRSGRRHSSVFGGSGFRRGDYWTFPARVASPTVEWPSEAPPQGVEHGLCPLALVTSGRSGVRCHDCRRAFAADGDQRRAASPSGRGCRAHEARQERP